MSGSAPQTMNLPVDLNAIRAAHQCIRPQIHRTPVFTSESLDKLTGAKLYFKCENLQKTGTFKFRGATNAVSSLTDEEAARGVVTQSSGNHGAAISRSEERRVGKECRSRWWWVEHKKKRGERG